MKKILILFAFGLSIASCSHKNEEVVQPSQETKKASTLSQDSIPSFDHVSSALLSAGYIEIPRPVYFLIQKVLILILKWDFMLMGQTQKIFGLFMAGIVISCLVVQIIQSLLIAVNTTMNCIIPMVLSHLIVEVQALLVIYCWLRKRMVLLILQ